MKFEFWRAGRKGREWYWHLKARNGKIIACGGGDGFTQFAGMVASVRNVFPDGMRRIMLERDLRKLVS